MSTKASRLLPSLTLARILAGVGVVTILLWAFATQHGIGLRGMMLVQICMGAGLLVAVCLARRNPTLRLLQSRSELWIPGFLLVHLSWLAARVPGADTIVWSPSFGFLADPQVSVGELAGAAMSVALTSWLVAMTVAALRGTEFRIGASLLAGSRALPRVAAAIVVLSTLCALISVPFMAIGSRYAMQRLWSGNFERDWVVMGILYVVSLLTNLLAFILILRFLPHRLRNRNAEAVTARAAWRRAFPAIVVTSVAVGSVGWGEWTDFRKSPGGLLSQGGRHRLDWEDTDFLIRLRAQPG